uniref:Uncharacterized protein n=1 Tax=Desulfovibrio sp. U5L TaxID=596152 RepID=I2Q2Q6_9BACT
MTTIPTHTMTLLAEVLDERMRQIAKGYTLEHDDAHQRGELSQGAAALVFRALARHEAELDMPVPLGFPAIDDIWPFGDAGTPDKPVRACLLAAIAMLLAEVERLDRLREAGAIAYCGCGRLVWRDETVVDVESVVLCPECAPGHDIAYAHEPNSIARFLRERCDRTPEGSETAADLYAAYRDWYDTQPEASEKHVRPMMVFGLELQALPWITGVQAFGAKYWKGVALRRED